MFPREREQQYLRKKEKKMNKSPCSSRCGHAAGTYSSAARDYITAAVPSGAAQEAARYPAGSCHSGLVSSTLSLSLSPSQSPQWRECQEKYLLSSSSSESRHRLQVRAQKSPRVDGRHRHDRPCPAGGWSRPDYGAPVRSGPARLRRARTRSCLSWQY